MAHADHSVRGARKYGTSDGEWGSGALRAGPQFNRVHRAMIDMPVTSPQDKLKLPLVAMAAREEAKSTSCFREGAYGQKTLLKEWQRGRRPRVRLCLYSTPNDRTLAQIFNVGQECVDGEKLTGATVGVSQ